jgi:type I restriction enzyme R subunit
LIDRNVTRVNFAHRIQEIIDRYNSGGANTEDYFDDLVAFVEKLREEEQRAAREGLSESELEIFDLIKKENLTKKEEQKVKNAAKSLLKRLREDKPTVLINDWYKDSQTRIVVKDAIQNVLNNELPETYDQVVFNSKCDNVYNHLYRQAVDDKAVA